MNSEMIETRSVEMAEALLESLNTVVTVSSIITMSNEMIIKQYQEMGEAHCESLSHEEMGLSITITKNVMTTTHQRMMDVIKHV